LVESLESFFRNRDAGNNVNNLGDGFFLVVEVSEELVEEGLDTIPSSEFSGKIFLSNGEISLSLLSESFGISNVLDALFEGSSVIDNSLSGIINSLLRDSHEVRVSGELVSFSSLGVGDTLEHFSSDGLEFGSESSEHFWVSEISKLEESLDHSTIFGFSERLLDFLERSLDFGDLNHRGSTRVKTGEELEALIDSIDGKVSFLNVSDVLGVILSSLSGSSIHSSESLNNEFLISGNLGFKGGLEWVKDVVKRRGSLSDIRFGRSDSSSDGSFPFVMFGQLDVVVLSVDINLKLVVSHEILEGLDEVLNW